MALFLDSRTMSDVSKYVPIITLATASAIGCAPKEPEVPQPKPLIVEVGSASEETREDIAQCMNIEGERTSKQMLAALRAVIEKYKIMHHSEFLNLFSSFNEFRSKLISELLVVAEGFSVTDGTDYHCAEIGERKDLGYPYHCDEILGWVAISSKPDAYVSLCWARQLFYFKVQEKLREGF